MFQSVIEKAALPILILNAEGMILFANGGVEGLCGYAAGKLNGLKLQDICAPYERQRFIFFNLSKIVDTVEVDIDLRIKSGKSITANIIFSPFAHKGGPHLLLVLRDVTTKRVQEGQLRESEERYRKLLAECNDLASQLNRSAKLACLGEIAAGIAHEINNPLGIILGFAQEMAEEVPQDHALFEPVSIIEQETVRCVGVVKRLLDLARLKPPQIADVNLTRLLDDSIALLMPQIKKNRIHVTCDIDENLPALRVDPQQLRQALINLMINAIQSMPLGGALTIAAHRPSPPPACPEAHRVQISITDTGQGIAPEHLERIFDPFFSTKGSKGTGLGLPISLRIIEDHCGRIEVHSRQGVGTECLITLPVQ